MCTEIEAKLKVELLSQIEDRLNELGAEFVEEQLQTDYYFDDANKELTKADRALRLRQQLVGLTEKIFLTYKGARENDNFKKRQEIEFEVSDCPSAQKLLLAIGLQ